MTTRRSFLQSATLAATAAFMGMPSQPRFSFAQDAGGKVFIKAFMRGGADGLHLFPRYADPFYYQYRPDIAIEGPNQQDSQAALSMGNFPGAEMRGMNPNLAPLLEMWFEGDLLVSPATNLTEGNRSHFDCQRWIATGTRNNLIDGYLNRYLQLTDGPQATQHPIRGATLGKSDNSREMQGSFDVPSVRRQNEFDIRNSDFCSGGSGCPENRLLESMEATALHPTDLNAAEGTIKDSQLLMIETIAEVQGLGEYVPNDAAREIAPDYSNTNNGRGLKLIAQLIKGNVPLEVAAINIDGSWDSHASQILVDDDAPFTNTDLSFNRRMAVAAQDLAMFYRDMGSQMDNIVVLVCTEFGRTTKQNGSFGTDHGNASAWMAFGGGIQGGFAEDVATLDENALVRGNYLPTVIDYRDLVGEILVRHLGLSDDLVGTVFPGHNFNDYGFFTGTS